MGENSPPDEGAFFSLRRLAIGILLATSLLVGIGGVIEGIDNNSPIVGILGFSLISIVIYISYSTVFGYR